MFVKNEIFFPNLDILHTLLKMSLIYTLESCSPQEFYAADYPFSISVLQKDGPIIFEEYSIPLAMIWQYISLVVITVPHGFSHLRRIVMLPDVTAPYSWE